MLTPRGQKDKELLGREDRCRVLSPCPPRTLVVYKDFGSCKTPLNVHCAHTDISGRFSKTPRTMDGTNERPRSGGSHPGYDVLPRRDRKGHCHQQLLGGRQRPVSSLHDDVQSARMQTAPRPLGSRPFTALFEEINGRVCLRGDSSICSPCHSHRGGMGGQGQTAKGPLSARRAHGH